MKQRILVIEDDAGLARILRDNLIFEGFDVQSVADGKMAAAKAREFAPDLILLDLMLPGKTGFELCGVLRGRRQTPIVILTARSQKSDKLRGLHLGADDYITKPFDLEELIARIHAVLRRARQPVERLQLGRVTVDFRTLQATDGSGPVEFTHREFELLRYLAERKESVVSRTELLREVWGYTDTPQTRSVDHAIARLRRKIEADAHRPRFIHTVHGDGYCLTPDLPPRDEE
jgi:two-component system, OmpR family, response regulator VicR